MTPSEIIIASCLGLAPLLLGTVIGFGLAFLYGVRNDFFGARQNFLAFFWIEDWQLERRQRSMLLFWAILGAFAGGVLAASYVASVWPWWSMYLSGVANVC